MTTLLWGIFVVIQTFMSLFMFLSAFFAIISFMYLIYSDIVIGCIPSKNNNDTVWLPGVDIITFCVICYYEALIQTGSYNTNKADTAENRIVRLAPLMFFLDIGLLIWALYFMDSVMLLPLCLFFRLSFIYIFFKLIGV
jgi:hypothetical protein